MDIVQCAQGSQTWFQARCGKVTASEVGNVMAFLKKGEKKGGDTAARLAYKYKLIAEILTGTTDMDGYMSDCMRDGNEYEPIARAAYEYRNDVSVDQVGFIIHPTIKRFGCSPDGLIAPNGGLEIKSPKTKTHIGYMLAGTLPPDYEPQVMTNIACAAADWWDFTSYGIRMQKRYQLLTVRVYRDDKRIAEIEQGVLSFWQEVDDLLGEIRRLYPPLPDEPAVYCMPVMLLSTSLLEETADDAVDPNPYGDLGILESDIPNFA